MRSRRIMNQPRRAADPFGGRDPTAARRVGSATPSEQLPSEELPSEELPSDELEPREDPVSAIDREMDDVWGGPEIGVMTKSQARGLVLGAIIGGLIGAVLLQPLALIHIEGFGPLWRMAAVGVAGALAGATAGSLYLGGRLPQTEGEVDPEDLMEDVRDRSRRSGHPRGGSAQSARPADGPKERVGKSSPQE